MAALRGNWRAMFPRCADRECSAARRMRRRLACWHAGVRLNGSWYCSPQCLEKAVRQNYARGRVTALAKRAAQHRIPLGLLLLSRGQLTNPQLRAALQAQQDSGRGRIGYWLEHLGFATEQQVTAALGLQWACPVLPSSAPRDPACLGMLPFPLLESFRMLPVRFVAATQVLYIAFCDGIDYPALNAIEQMLDCRTEACLLSHSALDQGLEQMAEKFRSRDLIFEGRREVGEMARITASYALKLGAAEARIVNCGDYLWTRLLSQDAATNLLFRRPVVGLVEATTAVLNPFLPHHATG
jgi:hypothetical protein